MVQSPQQLQCSQVSLRALYLTPCYYLFYIDDLPSIVQSLFSKVNLFADDILLFLF